MPALPRLLAAAVSAALLLNGCANSSANQYTTSQAQNAARVYYGEVLSVTPTTIKGESSPLITTAGSLLGGIGGSNIGKGRGEAVSAILGAIIGGLGAEALTRSADSQRGYEIVVQLEGTRDAVSVVQKDDIAFQPGQRVRVLQGGNGVTRVLPLNQPVRY
ncbi:hypothetical protein H9Q10_01165 [Eikenella sp. S3360]|uniref:Glycine zipper 2TM domain-containing protein n=1 Tax=Eikenella glucosivorans TaxID=2766967 RepID=A0ABS0N7I8_9NEIS|nr:hypothetical protein [Eikenella glucosivorans]MBH5328283.1 hypothetical protein [Eikenella glucosivorans]